MELVGIMARWPFVQAVHSTTLGARSVDLPVREDRVGRFLPGGLMAWKWPKLASSSATTEEWTGFIDQGVTLEGTLQVTGTFRINGNVKGNIISEQTVILGENAKVEGQIEGNSVVIAGRFDGVIFAKGRVEIQAKGVVTGEVHSPCMVVDPGGIFDGRCHMLASSDATSGVTIPIRAVGRS
jgi:cytoskeletal protein CcmA (bactofilin family)